MIFPFKPYDIQVDYMRAVITSLQKKENALLESPTGTGKTLSLLCGTLAWLDYRKYQDIKAANIIDVPDNKDYAAIKNVPENDDPNKKPGKKGKGWKNESPIRVIYSSRTHSQLNQACAELKRSYYRYCQTVTIGSRDQLCIHPEVTKLESISAKNQSCRMKVKTNTCSFHSKYEASVSDLSMSGSQVYDIEDLIMFGKEHKACPYYIAKAKTEFNTQLVFMPYNYILDPSIRKMLKLNLENSVIIFDEGHNIERVCEDSMSKELKAEWLTTFIKAFDDALKSLHQIESGQYDGTNERELTKLNMIDIAKVKAAICDLEKELDQMIRQNPKNNETYHKTIEIVKLFEKIQFDREKCSLISSVCDKLVNYVMSESTAFMSNAIVNALTSVCSFIESIVPFSEENDYDFQRHKGEFIRNYRVFSKIETDTGFGNKTWGRKKVVNSWTLNLWCMTPSMAIKSLKALGVYNIIITSGTLSPLESFEGEMGIPFPIKLQSTHVISKNQLSIQPIFNDSNGIELSGAFSNRGNVKYYYGLGSTIYELSKNIPKGIFIFFSSYTAINTCMEHWKNCHLWNFITGEKQVFIEPRSKNEFNASLNDFKEAVDKRSGAIFMGVSRGKLSEGMDLGDDYCRAVIIIGLPYPAAYDPKVVLKKKYMDDFNPKINGNSWYMLQMKRALNQSVGRVVRHKDDYGAIIICDSRFKNLSDGLSRWIQAFNTNMNAKINEGFGAKMTSIANFYKQHGTGALVQRPIRNEGVPPPPSIGMKPCASMAQGPAGKSNDVEVQSAFDLMKSSYKTNRPSNGVSPAAAAPKSSGDSKSIFNSLNYPTGKKRNFEP